jgi:hypothetical protein
MTITQQERERIINGSEETTPAEPRFHRSGVVSSLMGMLAGLGMLVLMSATLAAGGILLDLEFDLVATDGNLQELSAIAVSIAAVVLLASTLIGGFVAGRTARYGGMVVGLGASLWLTLVLAVFAGLTLWVGDVSNTFDGFNLADRLSGINAADLTMVAALTGAGLFLLAVLGGVLGGRFGHTEGRPPAETVVDLRDVEDTTVSEGEDITVTEVEDTRTSV